MLTRLCPDPLPKKKALSPTPLHLRVTPGAEKAIKSVELGLAHMSK